MPAPRWGAAEALPARLAIALDEADSLRVAKLDSTELMAMRGLRAAQDGLSGNGGRGAAPSRPRCLVVIAYVENSLSRSIAFATRPWARARALLDPEFSMCR